jgi:glyoxylase-like metal-dependent hydrolase (beta-lactamase superfamily II)
MRSRRTFLKHLGAAVAAAPFAPSLASELARADGFRALRRGVGTFTQRGGTIGWLVTDDGLVVVDTQYPRSAPDCWNGLRERSDSPLAMVVNTHHHGDHVGGNGLFAQHTDRIVAHANVPDLMRASAEQGQEDQKTYPSETFEDTWSESIGDETITLRYRGPAHTGGDAIIVFENANVVHVGDLVFNRAYPFIDVAGGADSKNWIAQLNTIHDALGHPRPRQPRVWRDGRAGGPAGDAQFPGGPERVRRPAAPGRRFAPGNEADGRSGGLRGVQL